jgi:hypothetical protein
MGPVLEYEKVVEVQGGLSQAAVNASKQALADWTQLKQALAEYDTALAARGMKF